MIKEDVLKKSDPLFAATRPKSALALQTQDEILNAALDLFNEFGATKITTHQIADKAGISPGNLYYHFKNKEEIIRALFWRMDLFSQFKWAGRGPMNPKESMQDFMRFIFGELSKYQFFFREFAALLQTDSILKKLWNIRYEHLYLSMQQTANLWVKAGILKPFANDLAIDAFIENFWIVANFSGVHGENQKRPMKPKATDLLISYLYPYHTEKGQRVLDLYLKI